MGHKYLDENSSERAVYVTKYTGSVDEIRHP